MPKINIILAFDYGTKKIGVAYGQITTKSAIPLETIKNNSHTLANIKALSAKWDPDAIVVGIPINAEKKNTSLIKDINAFISKLKQEIKLPVFTINETLSTVDAKSLIFDKYGYKGLKKIPIDSIAATLILEHWLKYCQQ